jgi:predicted GTPase
MKYGAGVVAAERGGATAIVDPRDLATGTIADVYRAYDIGPVLPAMGYSPKQLHELEQMINAADADTVIIATPMDLARLVTIGKPAVRVRYDLVEAAGSPTVEEVLRPVLAPAAPATRPVAGAP